MVALNSSPLEGRGKVRVITITLKLISGVIKRNTLSLRDTPLKRGILPPEYRNCKAISILLKYQHKITKKSY
jgi:hypothetical protein